MNDNNTATVRTTWNGTLVAGFIVLGAKLFGWEVTLDSLAPWLPVITVFIAVFYRLSLVVSETWPRVGWVLFGKASPPAYDPLPPPPAPLN
jgi:hypothetical protein